MTTVIFPFDPWTASDEEIAKFFSEPSDDFLAKAAARESVTTPLVDAIFGRLRHLPPPAKRQDADLELAADCRRLCLAGINSTAESADLAAERLRSGASLDVAFKLLMREI